MILRCSVSMALALRMVPVRALPVVIFSHYRAMDDNGCAWLWPVESQAATTLETALFRKKRGEKA